MTSTSAGPSAGVDYDSLVAEQRAVVESHARVVLVLGGAGVGKTTTALWAARRHLVTDPAFGRRGARRRVLFVTFSRTAVAQIRGRSAGVLEGLGDRIEILTFHGLAYRLIQSFGRYAGMSPDVTLRGTAQAKLSHASNEGPGLRYDDLLPAALRLLNTPGPIGDIIRSRWSLVVCDEFQDTNEDQWQLLRSLSSSARLLLLADPNQMIYGFISGVSDARLDAARAVTGCMEVSLPPGSHRDPSQIVPTAAADIRNRDFGSPAVALAVADGRLIVRSHVPDGDDIRAQAIAHEIGLLRDRGHQSFGVYAKTNNDTAGLSAALTEVGVDHVPIGFAESYGECLGALIALTDYAMGNGTWQDARSALAVAVTASVRSNSSAPPVLATALHEGYSVSPGFDGRVAALEASLRATDDDLGQAVDLATSAWTDLAMSGGTRSWRRACSSFRAMAHRAGYSTSSPLDRLRSEVERARTASFVELDGGDSGRTQLMNFSQTKGREADGVILSYLSADYYGRNAQEPYDEPSRILYVSLTRARQTVVILLPTNPHPLVAPFQMFASPSPT